MTTDIAAPDLTDIEADALVLHERVIERGLKTFVEVGTALAAIRDGRLYRTEYASFEAYCEQRWAMSRPRAYQLIEAAAVVSTTVDNGLPAPANERQARELARVPEAERTEVWAQAHERGNGRPTAETIREVVKERGQAPGYTLAFSDATGWTLALAGEPVSVAVDEDGRKLFRHENDAYEQALRWATDLVTVRTGRSVARWVADEEHGNRAVLGALSTLDVEAAGAGVEGSPEPAAAPGPGEGLGADAAPLFAAARRGQATVVPDAGRSFGTAMGTGANSTAAVPNPAVVDYVDADPAVQAADFMQRFSTALSRAGGWMQFDPERVAELASPTTWTAIESHAQVVAHTYEQMCRVRHRLRVLPGGTA